jgi:hypothetical protein
MGKVVHVLTGGCRDVLLVDNQSLDMMHLRGHLALYMCQLLHLGPHLAVHLLHVEPSIHYLIWRVLQSLRWLLNDIHLIKFGLINVAKRLKFELILMDCLVTKIQSFIFPPILVRMDKLLTFVELCCVLLHIEID